MGLKSYLQSRRDDASSAKASGADPTTGSFAVSTASTRSSNA